MKNQSTLYLACSALGLMALAAAPAPQAHDGDAHALSAVDQQQQLNSQRSKNDLVKIVRQVTEKYKSDAVAENDGYHLIFGCVSDEDSGAMGLHFVNLGLYAHADGTFDDQIDPYQPEIILYEPTPWGPKLTGADYLVDAETWNKTHGQAPELDGQIFHFFDAPNRFGLRPFYTLHVWAWKDSPTGTFVNWNKDVRCDAHNGPNK
jgi:hypothetical protein